jgi:predicted PurR-regulated permease PerM
LFYIQPLLAYLGSKFIDKCILVSDTFSNYYYKSVALNAPNAFSALSYLLLVLFYSICISVTIIYLREERNDLKKKIKRNLKDIASLKAQIKPTETVEEISEEARLIELDKIEAEENEILESVSKKGISLVTMYILSGFVVLFLFYTFAIKLVVSSENVVFRNDLVKIAPYITDNEIKTIQAKWTMMKNKADYEDVTFIVSEIKKNNKIE